MYYVNTHKYRAQMCMWSHVRSLKQKAESDCLPEHRADSGLVWLCVYAQVRIRGICSYPPLSLPLSLSPSLFLSFSFLFTSLDPLGLRVPFNGLSTAAAFTTLILILLFGLQAKIPITWDCVIAKHTERSITPLIHTKYSCYSAGQDQFGYMHTVDWYASLNTGISVVWM